MDRSRRARWIAAALATPLLLFPANAAAGDAPQLPTAAELTRATAQFLEHQPPAAAPPYAAGRPAPSTGAVLPLDRVVAFYGAPQMGQTILGRLSPPAAARKLAQQSLGYTVSGERPVSGEFDLVSVLATAGGGPDGLYRTRQADEVISIYLEQARSVGARLMLDIQPGRSPIAAEMRELGEWIAQPDVDVAIDPEWNVGPRGIPGQTPGEVSSREINGAVRRLASTVQANGLPAKLLVVHQFRRGMVRGRARIKSREGVQTVLNFDGIGAPAAKVAGYAALAAPSPGGLFNGFSLFYSRDRPLMAAADVLALEPPADFLLYQ